MLCVAVCCLFFSHLVRSIGEGGQIEPETEAILLANDIIDEEIADSAVESIKVPVPWTVPEVVGWGVGGGVGCVVWCGV